MMSTLIRNYKFLTYTFNLWAEMGGEVELSAGQEDVFNRSLVLDSAGSENGSENDHVSNKSLAWISDIADRDALPELLEVDGEGKMVERGNGFGVIGNQFPMHIFSKLASRGINADGGDQEVREGFLADFNALIGTVSNLPSDFAVEEIQNEGNNHAIQCDGSLKVLMLNGQINQVEEIAVPPVHECVSRELNKDGNVEVFVDPPTHVCAPREDFI
ncbi:unnamed protein product [Lupinus luteus]|uniref:Uncharacterized protein n=1 Tax=Lupinus luteus TaxID=3873 RepID=A0AAV1W0U3_LUPLU